jgi:hypothetical protein
MIRKSLQVPMVGISEAFDIQQKTEGGREDSSTKLIVWLSVKIWMSKRYVAEVCGNQTLAGPLLCAADNRRCNGCVSGRST